MLRFTVFFALTMGMAGSALAQAADVLATKYACVACHQAERRVVGPSWKEISTKYAGQEGAAAALVAAIKGGSSGKWGAVPMPPQPTVSQADAQALATWIVSQK